MSLFLSLIILCTAEPLANGKALDLEFPKLESVQHIKEAKPLKKAAPKLSKFMSIPSKELNTENYKVDFLDVYNNKVKPRIDKLTELIIHTAVFSIDLDGDKVNETVIVSEGVNPGAWGGKDFIAVLSKDGEVLFIEKIDPKISGVYGGETKDILNKPSKFSFCQIMTADLNTDKKPEVILNYLTSKNVYCLSILSFVNGKYQLNSEKSYKRNFRWSGNEKTDSFIQYKYKSISGDSLIDTKVRGLFPDLLHWSDKGFTK